MKSMLFVLMTLLLAACAGNTSVVEERVTYDHGIVRECGEGAGLSPCRDARGLTVAEEEDPNYIDTMSNVQLEKSAAEIRNENPEQLEQTIEAMEASQ